MKLAGTPLAVRFLRICMTESSNTRGEFLLVNKEEKNPHTVKVVLGDPAAKRRGAFTGPVRVVTFGSEQYVWHNDGRNSNASPDGPAVSRTVQGGPEAVYTLPKASVTVLRGKVAGL